MHVLCILVSKDQIVATTPHPPTEKQEEHYESQFTDTKKGQGDHISTAYKKNKIVHNVQYKRD